MRLSSHEKVSCGSFGIGFDCISVPSVIVGEFSLINFAAQITTFRNNCAKGLSTSEKIFIIFIMPSSEKLVCPLMYNKNGCWKTIEFRWTGLLKGFNCPRTLGQRDFMVVISLVSLSWVTLILSTMIGSDPMWLICKAESNNTKYTLKCTIATVTRLAIVQ